MNRTHPLWRKISEKTVYKGRLHIIEHKAQLPSGELVTYEVDHGANGAVAVLIRLNKDEIVLSYQYRFPLDRWIYDLPGGGIKNGETIEEAAFRECQEEVGIAPKRLVKLATFYPNPSRSDWPAHLYFCDEYTESALANEDASENVERVVMSINDLNKRIENHEIVDPSLLIAWHVANTKGLIARNHTG